MNKFRDSVIRAGGLLVQIITFLYGIYLTMTLNVERLSVRQSFNVALDIFAMIILIILVASSAYGRTNDSTNAFLLMSISVHVCVFFELGAWLVDGIAYLRTANYICNIGCNNMMVITTALLFYFTCKSLKVDFKKIRGLSILIIATVSVAIIAEFANYTYGFYYYIDLFGIYARSKFGSLIGFVPFIIIIGATVYLISIQKISWTLKAIYYLYMLVPLIASVWYTITEMPPTFFVSTFISMVLIYANIYIDIGKETTQYEIENAQKEAELARQRNLLTLSQIKPHFIFNALGSIEELCVVDAAKAEKAVNYFAKYLRANMDALGEHDSTSFASELEHIRNYIWLEKMRFEDELEFYEDIETESFNVPTLCVQPLIENAVKHGMMGTEEGTLHVTLRTRKNDEYYIIQITDDGCGFDVNEVRDDGRSHIGLSYSRTCIEHLNGRMEVKSVIGQGTDITLYIPREQ